MRKERQSDWIRTHSKGGSETDEEKKGGSKTTTGKKKRKIRSSFILSMICTKCYRILIGCLVAVSSCRNCGLCSRFFCCCLLCTALHLMLRYVGVYIFSTFSKKSQRTQNIDEGCWLERILFMCECDSFQSLVLHRKAISFGLFLLMCLPPHVPAPPLDLIKLFWECDRSAVSISAKCQNIKCSMLNVQCFQNSHAAAKIKKMSIIPKRSNCGKRGTIKSCVSNWWARAKFKGKFSTSQMKVLKVIYYILLKINCIEGY